MAELCSFLVFDCPDNFVQRLHQKSKFEVTEDYEVIVDTEPSN